MKPELPDPKSIANQLILVSSLLDQILTDPKYETYTEEISVIKKFKTGETKINEVIRAIESLAKKSTSP